MIVLDVLLIVNVECAVCLGAKLVQELHAALGEDGGHGTVLQPLEAGSEGRLKVEKI